MALTFQDYTANGSQTSFAIPFDRIRDVHVKVFFGATEVTTGWSVVGNNVVFSSAPANGTIVRIRRITDFTERLVDFVDGSRLNEVDLDTDSKQSFYLIQESRDINDVSMVKNSLGNWDANFDKIQSLADPTELNDATNKAYVDDIASNFASYGVGAPMTRWALTGNGLDDAFTITGANLLNSASYLVTIDGVVIDPDLYTITADTITFDTAPSGSSAIVVILLGYPRASSPDSVSTASIQNGAVTDAKLASSLNLSSKTLTLPSASVTAANLASTLDLSSKTITLPSGVVGSTNCAASLFAAIAPAGAVIGSLQVNGTNVTSPSLAATGANLVIPIDATVPQWTEGALAFSISYTPKYAASKIRITGAIPVTAPAAASWVGAAVFRGTGPSAIGGSFSYVAANTADVITFSCEETAGTTSSITYNLRFGGSAVGVYSTNLYYGQSFPSFLRVEEIKQ